MTQERITSRFVSIYYELYRNREVRSRAEFCRSVDILPSNFKKIEDGERDCTVRHICALIKLWNVNPTWIMTGKGKMFCA